ncbi:ParA family protein [Lactiplantibacillus plantarum]|uniref:ParA family protein n=1 Tax=Lactiplantibacillus plantarum TaxID=1590 RepID=UPI0021A6F61F|nr:ParA family protein [Lactiplantibacillus plantarum]MCT3250093.1 ParA family protein [Lactiplantibacillus plantarum]
MAKKIGIVQHKGGVGKTTTAVNLAGAIHIKEPNSKVLIYEQDGQGNAARSFGKDPLSYEDTAYDVIMDDVKPEDVAQNIYPGIDLIPANKDMNFVEFDMLNEFTKEQSDNFYQLIQQFRTDPQELFSMTKDDFNKYMGNNTTNIGSYYFNMLDGKLEGIDQKYDYIIFDTPPEMKAITSSVLSVVDSAIIPFEPDAYTVDGLINILSRIKAITTDYNPKLKIAGVLAEKVRKNVKIHSEVELAVAKYCMANNINYLQSEIPNSIRFASATGYKGLPATLVEEDDKFVKNYFKLYDELKKDKSL